MSAPIVGLAERIAGWLCAVDAEGAPKLNDSQMLHFLCALALTAARFSEPSQDVRRFVGSCARVAGAAEGDTAEIVQEKLTAWMAAHPLPPSTKRELRQMISDIDRLGADQARSVDILIGAAQRGGVLSQSVRPAGTVPAGPLARYQVDEG